jgi:hypothetical protein
MAKKWDEQNNKAMKDLFGAKKDNRIPDTILSKNKHSKPKQYRTHADSVWRSSEEVFSGSGSRNGKVNVCIIIGVIFIEEVSL